MTPVAEAVSPLEYCAAPTASLTGQTIDKLLAGIKESLWASEYSGSLRTSIKRALAELQEEHRDPNWDGYGALPLNLKSAAAAESFSELLPRGTALPEITVENDGEIAFEWDGGRRRIFSISFAPNGRIQYSGLFGYDKLHGTTEFCGKIPEIIRLGIKKAIPRLSR